MPRALTPLCGAERSLPGESSTFQYTLRQQVGDVGDRLEPPGQGVQEQVADELPGSLRTIALSALRAVNMERDLPAPRGLRRPPFPPEPEGAADDPWYGGHGQPSTRLADRSHLRQPATR